ncbi:Chromosome partition protein Smc [Pseudomonas sp. ACN8]|uniref:DNA-binding protein n=1 Tax=Pseudomonas sp. ACN8 TaxID=1920428 RepID=UPI000BB2D0C3|nr:DNA-binding protein [Pseudomonas sp. ACN8]PBJ18985.1 Chromosome partition protein Smc [Pseudomonas sp. ACN8]
MARGGINKALVHAARDALLGRGLHPSIDLVRVELGNTGSKSTIQRYLKELNGSLAANPAPPPTLNEKLTTLVSSLAEQLKQEARDAVADEQEQLERQQASYAQAHAQLGERLEQSQTTITHLTGELEQQRQCERMLREQLQDSEGERQQLRQLVAGQQQILEERAQQLQSLEDKHQHAREGLEHYRQEQLAQRGQELHRHDEQTNQLRQELRSLQNAQLAKQEELVTVYREQERLRNEHRVLHAQLRQQSQTLRDTQQAHDAQTTKLQQLQTEYAVLRERVKPYLLQHRENRRQMREQARQIETLQTLLRQLTPPG